MRTNGCKITFKLRRYFEFGFIANTQNAVNVLNTELCSIYLWTTI